MEEGNRLDQLFLLFISTPYTNGSKNEDLETLKFHLSLIKISNKLIKFSYIFTFNQEEGSIS